MMKSLCTKDRHGYSVKFSRFDANQLLVASSQLFGLAGGGTLFLLEIQPMADDDDDGKTSTGGCLKEVCRMEWTDGLFDVVWCPFSEHVAATSSGDGTIQIWGDLNQNGAGTSEEDDNTAAWKGISQPSVCLQEHKHEVYSIDWGEQWNQHHLLSASWDGTLKLWDCNHPQSLVTLKGHVNDFIYCTKFSPLIANLCASVGTDGYLNLWNCFDSIADRPLMSIPVGVSSELLALDWSQFDRNVLATGGSDGCVRGWDLRNMRAPSFELYSGESAVRRLSFSPSSAGVLASANYDFSTRIWDLTQSRNALEVNQNHTEFVCGLDWNPNSAHELVDCGWDSLVNVYQPVSLTK